MLIGQKIRKLRELKNFTQEYMASELGLNQSAYSRIENGTTDIPFSKIEKIASLLEIKPEDLISFNEQMVFNVMNNQNGQNGLVINNNHLSDTEKNLYIDQIELLKNEIAYLKSVLDKVLKQ